MPRNKRATYVRIVCAIRPNKTEKYRVRLTAGGNLVHYDGEKNTPTVSLETIKIHWNSVISTKGAKYCTIDLNDFFLIAALLEYEYIKIPISLFPPGFIVQYNLNEIVHSDGYVYAEVCGGMYGLPQAGRLAHDDLVQYMAGHGYIQVKFTPGL